ncbi:hypothetical protein CROQUDRAFT_661884 [Cronartium quercuum f. sp. fusiforme G11]|uniref:Cation efflux protein cytoplasmic domain-containing protein n=1 Tax=Cronartium quercuum f. sp. fusiforme G11 TaxID=708437 RepID=A0A9P6NAE7_9BASI|nr:hypothetical protein CROQUDRAFT_661884 [Cronartium quercuum f. sp. fusiforme G11]
MSSTSLPCQTKPMTPKGSRHTDRVSISSQLPSPPPTPRDGSVRVDFDKADPTQLRSVTDQAKPVPYDEGQWSTFLSPGANLSDDPLLLRSRLQDEQALGQLRKRGRKAKPLGNFYETQNEHINCMLRTLEQDAKEGQEESSSSAKHVRWAVRSSFVINCLLAVLQLYAAISSLSLSFFATALDAVFDPCANLALNYAHRYAARVDLRKYPSGGSRFETIGNIIYSAVMGCASVVLVVESLQTLIENKPPDNVTYHLPAVITVCVSFLAKLALFIYCWAVRNQDSQVRVLWEDHRNDLFINAFGIFTNAAGAHIKWWIDPLGALLISLALIVLWGDSISREFKLLAGQSAPVDFLQRVVYKAMTFSSHIEKIDSCRCYHVGPNYFVEIDIVIDGNTPLWLAHDLGQELQDKLEALPMVDRAFVHLDHEVEHKPEHGRYT